MERKPGVALYRIHVGVMCRFAHDAETFWDVVRTLKHALDRDAILSPGRYVRIPATQRATRTNNSTLLASATAAQPVDKK